MIYPMIGGGGTPLFDGQPGVTLRLPGTRTFTDAGVIIAQYAVSRVKKQPRAPGGTLFSENQEHKLRAKKTRQQKVELTKKTPEGWRLFERLGVTLRGRVTPL